MKINLTLPEINHLLSLLRRNKDDGTYYAPERQYWTRAERIQAKLEDATFDEIPGGRGLCAD